MEVNHGACMLHRRTTADLVRSEDPKTGVAQTTPPPAKPHVRQMLDPSQRTYIPEARSGSGWLKLSKLLYVHRVPLGRRPEPIAVDSPVWLDGDVILRKVQHTMTYSNLTSSMRGSVLHLLRMTRNVLMFSVLQLT